MAGLPASFYTLMLLCFTSQTFVIQLLVLESRDTVLTERANEARERALFIYITIFKHIFQCYVDVMQITAILCIGGPDIMLPALLWCWTITEARVRIRVQTCQIVIAGFYWRNDIYVQGGFMRYVVINGSWQRAVFCAQSTFSKMIFNLVDVHNEGWKKLRCLPSLAFNHIFRWNCWCVNAMLTFVKSGCVFKFNVSTFVRIWRNPPPLYSTHSNQLECANNSKFHLN